MNITPKFEHLPYRERLLIWSLRMSYAPAITDQATGRALEQAFRFAQIEAALPSFHGYANAIATCLIDNNMTVDMHAPPCPALGRDEWYIIETIAALQIRDYGLATSFLQTIVPQYGIHLCCDIGTSLAHVLRRNNFLLRRPAWSPFESNAQCPHHPRSQPHTPVIH